MIKIDKKIETCAVINLKEQSNEPKHLLLERPELLEGTTYKVKTPLSEHALYISINNCRDHNNKAYPFEIFINSKSMEHFQWIVALTRIISAVFRKGGDCTFLVEELRSVFDPKGGYFKKGKYVHSLVAEIGDVIEQHLVSLGLMQIDNSLALSAQKMLKEKKSSTETNMLLCTNCQQVAAVLMDGCLTCTSCGHSKCN